MSDPLRPVSHPHWGCVHPMSTEKQPTHVWQHLYNPEERWDGLVGTEIHALRSAAEKLGCPPQPPKRQRGQKRPQLPEAPQPYYPLLRQHHDAHYGPAYLRELRQPGTEWAPNLDEPWKRLLCCTPCGVLVGILRERPATRRRKYLPGVVRTAFRPDLGFRVGSVIDDAAYHQEAVNRWEGSTMRDNSAWKTGVLRELEQSSQQPPLHTVEAWRLVRAIGLGRTLAGTEPDVASRLSPAEQLLTRHQEDISRLLEGRLRTEELLAGLESSLEAEEPEEAQDRLLALSDILVVSEVLNLSSEIERIHSEVREVLASWPSGMPRLTQLARARLGTSGLAAQPLWEAVLTAQPPLSKEAPSEPLQARVKRILEAIPLMRLQPTAAHASSGVGLGPKPIELHRSGGITLMLTRAEDLQTPVLQVSGLSSAEVPRGTRDGRPLSFRWDEFHTWLTEAVPGKYSLTLRDETVEFTLVSS